jgi:hypothetical protein
MNIRQLPGVVKHMHIWMNAGKHICDLNIQLEHASRLRLSTHHVYVNHIP